MKKISLIVALLLAIHSYSQKTNQPSTLYITPQVGLLNGDHAVSAQVVLSGGMKTRTWSYGIGAGVDYYKIRSAPLFVELKKDLGKKETPLFAYLQLGTNIAWPLASDYRENSYTPWSGITITRFRNGMYGELGIGYTGWYTKKKGIWISLGYSAKTMAELHDEVIYPDFPPYDRITKTERKLAYTFNRLVLKIGCRL
ncbi:MAG TPA: hypothetical protein VGE25_08460 [Sediminibacterium sp.]